MKLVNLVKATKGNTTMDTTNNIVLAQTVINNTYSICGKRIASVPVALMEIDHSYQRILGATVNKLMEEWDNDKCDFLIVSYRDNKYYIIDGQHRYSVAKAKGIEALPCIIFTGLTQSDEALKFAQQQDNVNKLYPYDTFKANIACGNANIRSVFIDMEIKRICDAHNVEVKKVSAWQKNPKALRTLSRARSIVDKNGSECFDWILTVIENSNWELCSESYTKEIMELLKNFYVENKDCIRDAEECILKVFNNISPRDMIAKAKYTYSEYPTTAALGLCLRDLLHEVTSNAKITTNVTRSSRIA